jgi:hypothetical protein
MQVIEDSYLPMIVRYFLQADTNFAIKVSRSLDFRSSSAILR